MRELIGREIGLVAGGFQQETFGSFEDESRQPTVTVKGRRSDGSVGVWRTIGRLADIITLLPIIGAMLLSGGGSNQEDSDGDESEDMPPPGNDDCVITYDPYAPGGGHSWTLEGDCEDYPPGTIDNILQNVP